MNISIIGLGGTGSMLVTPLCRYLYSQDKLKSTNIIFADGDKYSLGNIERQDFITDYIGENKAKYSWMKHCLLFKQFADNFSYISEYIGNDNINSVMEENGLMFICVDNNYFRRIADEKIMTMQNFTIISCGNDMYDGQVQIIQYINGKNITKETLVSRHKEIKKAITGDRSEMSCDELAILPGGGQIVVTNMMAATIALCYFINQYSVNNYVETFFDTKSITTRNVDV